MLSSLQLGEMLCSVSCRGVVVSMPVLQAGNQGLNPGCSETFTVGSMMLQPEALGR